MCGTSLDGIDAALVEVEGRGLDVRARFVRGHAVGLGALADAIRSLAAQQPATAAGIAALTRELSLLHVQCIAELLGDVRVHLVAAHGATVVHQPPVSWQMLQPALVAHALACPVVSDLRAADVALGGQGAPITPIADWLLLRQAAATVAVVNLGGYCNVTLLPAASVDALPTSVRAADVCACNHLLDDIARRRLGRPFDTDGQAARLGRTCPELVERLLVQLRAQASAGRSLGTGDELGSWVDQTAAHPAEDVARSACEAIATVIAQACAPAERVLLAGGSVRHRVLVECLARRCPAPVSPTDEFGVPARWREAIHMAVLGALCQDRVPITLPMVTGVRPAAPVAGTWVMP